jgi:hypothetical protein
VLGFARHGLMVAVFLLAAATSLPSQYLTQAFATATMPPPGGLPGYFSIAADFNQNGYADIAYFPALGVSFLVDLDPAVSGVGPYTPQIYYAGAQNGIVSQSAASDVDGDGLLDLVLSDPSGAISIHIGNGNGTFVPAGGSNVNFLNTPYPLPFRWIAMTDVNNDGAPDVLALYQYHGTSIAGGLLCHLNQFPNWPQAWSTSILSGVDLSAGGPRVGDFDGDGNVDLALTCGNATAGIPWITNVLWGNGTGQFTLPSTSPTLGLSVGWRVAGAADMNGDGITDLVCSQAISVGGAATEQLQVYLGSPTRTLVPAGSFVVPSPGSLPVSTIAADFNRDGWGDLLRAPSSDPYIFNAVPVCNSVNLTMALGLPGGQLHQSGMTTTATPFPSPTYCPSSLVADFDGDGDLDLVCTPSNSPFYYFSNQTLNGVGCAGSSTAPPNLRPSNAQVGNQSFDATIFGASSNVPALLAVTAGLSNSPLNPCGVYLDLAGPVVFLPGMTNALGSFVWPLPIAANPALHGAVASAQAAVLDPLGPSFGGVNLSLTPARTVIIW